MSKFVTNLMTYPARWTGAVGTFAGAVYVLAGAFHWWTWTAEQATAVTGVTTAGLGVVTAFAVHALVTPNNRLPDPAPPVHLPDYPSPAVYAPQINAAAVEAVIPAPTGSVPGDGPTAGVTPNPPSPPPGA